MWEMNSDGCACRVCVFHARFDLSDTELAVSRRGMGGRGGLRVHSLGRGKRLRGGGQRKLIGLRGILHILLRWRINCRMRRLL